MPKRSIDQCSSSNAEGVRDRKEVMNAEIVRNGEEEEEEKQTPQDPVAALTVDSQLDELIPFEDRKKDDNVLVCMRTHHTPQWRTLLDVLKDLVPECPVTFTEHYMKLMSTDPKDIVLVDVDITAEFYFCREEVTVGLDLHALYRNVRNLTTIGFILELVYLRDDPARLHVNIINSEKRTTIMHKLNLLKLDDETINMPPADFSRVLSMQAIDFQKYIKEMCFISNRITVLSNRSSLCLSAEGSKGTMTAKIQPTRNGMAFVDQQQAVKEVKGTFLAKYLEKFSRPLASQVQLWIKEDYPLLLRYQMATAFVKFAIAPIEMDEDENAADVLHNEVDSP